MGKRRKMPCWPDIWEYSKGLLPVLGMLACVFGYISLIAFLLWAPRQRNRWLVFTLRILGAVGILPLVVAVPAIFLGFLLAVGNPPAQIRLVKSPDGQQAWLRYNAGFLGRDSTEVIVKRTGCCEHAKVFWHDGPSSFDDPKLEWVDNRLIRLTYHARPGDPQHCESRVGDVAIVCASQPWPDSPSISRPTEP